MTGGVDELIKGYLSLSDRALGVHLSRKGENHCSIHLQQEAYNMIQKQIKTLIEAVVQKQFNCSQLLSQTGH